MIKFVSDTMRCTKSPARRLWGSADEVMPGENLNEGAARVGMERIIVEVLWHN
jgi:hypothetical protein